MEIYNYRTWVKETDEVLLKERIPAMLSHSGYHIVNYVEHQFNPEGFTAVWLLSESHLAIHTYPELGKTYLELSGCDEKMNIVFQSLIKQGKLTFLDDQKVRNSID